MAKYKCSVCGYIYDEEKEGKPFSELTECPVCKQPVSEFHKVEDDNPVVRNYRYMKEIQQMAATGISVPWHRRLPQYCTEYQK